MYSLIFVIFLSLLLIIIIINDIIRINLLLDDRKTIIQCEESLEIIEAELDNIDYKIDKIGNRW